MLEGWYCRTMANQQPPEQALQQNQNNLNDDVSDDSQEPEQSNSTNTCNRIVGADIDYKSRYLDLKRKLKFLIYENEFFQDTLRFNQRRLLKISRDRAFLLDRLLQYEKPGNTSSEEDLTDSSDDDTTASAPVIAKEIVRRRKIGCKSVNVGSGAPRGRKRKAGQNDNSQNLQQKQKKLQTTPPTIQEVAPTQRFEPPVHVAAEQDKSEIQLTTAEITRQLQARKPSVIELMSVECTSATVPATMLSDESPSKCFQNEQPTHYLDNASPSHVAAEECVPMEYIN